MALEKKRLSINSEGPFFVDSSCIYCGSCWQIDPKHFASNKNTAYVYDQPNGKKEIEKAFLALIDCPVSAIKAPKKFTSDYLSNLFPIPVTTHPAGDVYYCGWSSRHSFGASSWLITNPEGNVLIDSPRWSSLLAKQIINLGGVSKMILTHRDDVADHAKWAKALSCERWIHKDDLDAAPEVEKQITGIDEISIRESLRLIPTPGHSKGSIVAVLGNQNCIIFSGDHLWWNIEREMLVASKEYCWWNWVEQLNSVKKLKELDIKWLLPGHGHAKKFNQGEWKIEIEKILNNYKKERF